MKKFIAIVTVCMIVLSAFSASVFAAEAGEEIIPALPYEEGAGMSPSIWLNRYDADGNCYGSDYVIFNTKYEFTGVGFPVIYAGKSSDGRDSDVKFELFRFDTDAEKTAAGEPVFSEERHFDGDVNNVTVPFTEAAPAGQYMLKVSQTTPLGDRDPAANPYSVLPTCDLKFSDTKLEFGVNGKFAFFVMCKTAEHTADFYVNLGGQSDDVDIQPEKTLIARDGNNAREIIELGIVTPVIPDGQVLYSIVISDSPTWNNTNGDSDVEVNVYKWKDDYDESVDGTPVFYAELTDHADNSNLTIKFGTALRYGNRYLIVITQSNSGKVGYWQGVEERPDGWEFYELASEIEYNPAMKTSFALVGDLGPEPTEPPTPEPTEVPPTEEPTEAPTEAPATQAPATSAATDAPKATDAPASTAQGGGSEPKASGNNVLPIVIIAICAVVVIASVIAIILAKKKKK